MAIAPPQDDILIRVQQRLAQRGITGAEAASIVAKIEAKLGRVSGPGVGMQRAVGQPSIPTPRGEPVDPRYAKFQVDPNDRLVARGLKPRQIAATPEEIAAGGMRFAAPTTQPVEKRGMFSSGARAFYGGLEDAGDFGVTADMLAADNRVTFEVGNRFAQIQAQKRSRPMSEGAAAYAQASQGGAMSLLSFAADRPGAFLQGAIDQNLQSLGSTAASIVGAPLAGALAPTLMGSGSGLAEASNELAAALEAEGVDVTDGGAVTRAMNTPDIRARVRDRVLTKSTVVGGADFATMGIASRIPGGKTFVRKVFGQAAKTGVEAVGGMAGEALSQVASGQDLQTGDILSEGIGELLPGSAQIAALGARRLLNPTQPPPSAPTPGGPAPGGVGGNARPPSPPSTPPSASAGEAADSLDERFTMKPSVLNPLAPPPAAPTPAPDFADRVLDEYLARNSPESSAAPVGEPSADRAAQPEQVPADTEYDAAIATIMEQRAARKAARQDTALQDAIVASLLERRNAAREARRAATQPTETPQNPVVPSPMRRVDRPARPTPPTVTLNPETASGFNPSEIPNGSPRVADRLGPFPRVPEGQQQGEASQSPAVGTSTASLPESTAAAQPTVPNPQGSSPSPKSTREPWQMTRGEFEGQSKVWNHQTWREFSTFDMKEARRLHPRRADSIDSLGFWFTDAKNTRMYGPVNVASRVQVTNPYSVRDTDTKAAWSLLDEEMKRAGGPQAFREKLIRDGHDGVVLENTRTDMPKSSGESHNILIAFDPAQIEMIGRDVDASAFEGQPTKPTPFSKHRAIVESALAAGKPVPAEVLAEYGLSPNPPAKPDGSNPQGTLTSSPQPGGNVPAATNQEPANGEEAPQAERLLNTGTAAPAESSDPRGTGAASAEDDALVERTRAKNKENADLLARGIDPTEVAAMDRKIDAALRIMERTKPIFEAPQQTPGPMVTGRSGYTMGKKLDAENNRRADAFREYNEADKDRHWWETRKAAYLAGEVHANGQPRADAPSRKKSAIAKDQISAWLKTVLKPGQVAYVAGNSPVTIKRVNDKTITTASDTKWDLGSVTPKHATEDRPMTPSEVVAAIKDAKPAPTAADFNATTLPHHVAVYGDKAVSMEYVEGDQFKLAGMRVADNAGEGYIVTPTLKVFAIRKGKKYAQRVTDQAEADRAIEKARGAFGKATEPATEPAPGNTAKAPARATADDIPMDVAERAFTGTSFMPEKRARTWQSYYVNDFNNLAERFRKLADTDELRAAVEEELTRFQEGLKSKYLAYLGAHSRVMSSMITGPARFPVEANRKRMDSADKRLAEIVEFVKRADKSITKRLFPQASGVIRSDDENAPNALRAKIEGLQRRQEAMKDANKIIRKGGEPAAMVPKLEALGFSNDEARRVLFPQFQRGMGFPGYALTNNSANIRRLQERLTQIEAQRAREPRTATFPGGGRVVENAEMQRVQIIYPDKPDDATLEKLKSRGFKWAPSQGAHQRLMNEHAWRAALQVTGATEDAKAPAQTENTEEIDAAEVAAEVERRKQADADTIPQENADGTDRGTTGGVGAARGDGQGNGTRNAGGNARRPEATRPKKPVAFSRADITARILKYAEETQLDKTEWLNDLASEDASGQVNNEFSTYFGDETLRGEIEHWLEGRPYYRRFFKFNVKKRGISGEESFQRLGYDRYFALVEETFTPTKVMKERVQKLRGMNPDVDMLLWLDGRLDSKVADEVTATGKRRKAKRPAYDTVTAGDLRDGQTFQIDGENFEVMPDKNGILSVVQRAEDGGPTSDPEIWNIDGLTTLPMDRGTLASVDTDGNRVVEDNSNPELDADLERLAGLGAPEAPPKFSDSEGVFGQKTESITGTQRGMFGDISPEPTPEMKDRYPGIRRGESVADYEKRMGTTDTPEMFGGPTSGPADPGIPFRSPPDFNDRAAARLNLWADRAMSRAMARIEAMRRGEFMGSGVDPTPLLDLASAYAFKALASGITSKKGRALTKFVTERYNELAKKVKPGTAMPSLSTVRNAVAKIMRAAGDDRENIPEAYAAARAKMEARQTKDVGAAINRKDEVKAAVADATAARPDVSARIIKAVKAAYRQGKAEGMRTASDALKPLIRQARDAAKRARQVAAIETRGAVDAAKNAAADQAATEKGIRDQAVRLVQETPIAGRGKYLRAVAGAKTMGDLARILHRLRGDLAKETGRHFAARAERLAKNLRKLDADRLQNARKLLDDIRKMYEKLRDKDTGTATREELAEQIRESFETLNSIFHEQRNADKVYMQGRAIKLAEHRDQMMQAIQQQAELPQPENAKEDREPAWLRQKLRKYGDFRTLMQILDRVWDETGIFAKARRAMSERKTAELAKNHEFIDRSEQIVKANGYESWSDFMERTEGAMGDSGTEWVHIDLGPVNRITVGQAMALYAQDAETKELMHAGQPWRLNRNGNPFVVDDYKLAELESKLTPGQKRIARQINQLRSDMQFERADGVYKRITGNHMVQVDGQYPRKRILDKSGSEDTIDIAKLSMGEWTVQSLENSGFTITRVKDKKTPLLLEDFGSTQVRSFQGTEMMIQRAEMVKYLKATLFNPAISDAIAQRYGGSIMKRLTQVVAEYSGNSAPESDKFIRKIAAGSARSMTQVNPGTWARNLSTVFRLPLAMLDGKLMGPAAVAMAIPEALANWRSTLKTLMEHSPDLRHRWSHAGASISMMTTAATADVDSHFADASKATLRQLVYAAKAFRNPRAAASRLGQVGKGWNQILDSIKVGNAFDAFAAVVAYHAIRSKAPESLSPRAGDKWAARKAADAFLQTANTNDLLNANEWQTDAKRNTGAALILTFTSDIAKMQNLLFLARKRGRKAQALAAGAVATSMVWATLINYALASLLGDDEEKKNKDAINTMREELVSLIPGGTNLWNPIIDAMTGSGRARLSVLDTPVTSIIRHAEAMVNELRKDESDPLEMAYRASRLLLDPVGNPFAPISGMARRAIKNYAD